MEAAIAAVSARVINFFFIMKPPVFDDFDPVELRYP